MMDQIYRRAVETVIWLGPDSHNSLAFNTIARVLQAEATLISKDARFEPIDLTHAERDAMHNLILNPYWTRHWIVQELILSREHDRTLWYGSSSLPLASLQSMMRRHKDLITNSPWFHLSHPTQMLDNTETALTSLTSESTRDKDGYGVWLAATKLAKTTKCSDPRDKIYGMQALFPKVLRVDVDYGREVADVYRDAVTKYEGILGPKWEACIAYENIAQAMGWRVLKPPYYRGYCAEHMWRSKEENKKAFDEMIGQIIN